MEENEELRGMNTELSEENERLKGTNTGLAAENEELKGSNAELTEEGTKLKNILRAEKKDIGRSGGGLASSSLNMMI